MAEINLTNDMFEQEVLQSDVPVLVDFWATWCGPCRMVAPIVEEIADEYDGKVKVCKVNVDEEEDLAMRFGIRSVPTIVFLKDGKEKDRVVGAAARPVFDEKIQALL